MYSVTKKIDFCYGHRLMDYDGVCRHPHGHNAVAEIELRTDSLDARNMVCDFSDIKRIVKGWIDRELDHKMVLRHDDPLVAPLRAELGGLPPMLVQSSTGDPLLDGARQLTEHARAHQVDIRLELYPATAHAFQIFWSFLPEAADAVRSAGAFVRARS